MKAKILNELYLHFGMELEHISQNKDLERMKRGGFKNPTPFGLQNNDFFRDIRSQIHHKHYMQAAVTVRKKYILPKMAFDFGMRYER